MRRSLDDEILLSEGDKFSHHAHSPCTPKKKPPKLLEQFNIPPMVHHWSASKPVEEDSALTRSELISFREASDVDHSLKIPKHEVSARKKRRPSISIETNGVDSKYQSKITN